MRAKTTDFLKVLNRARPEPKVVEKKTITYVLESFHILCKGCAVSFGMLYIFHTLVGAAVILLVR